MSRETYDFDNIIGSLDYLRSYVDEEIKKLIMYKAVPAEEKDGTTIRYRCSCGERVEYRDRFCRSCGRRMCWNG